MKQVNKGIVLVVDDELTHLEGLLEYLQWADFEVLVAENGADALACIAHSQPDIILLDIKLPDISGFELCRRLQGCQERAGIPVIFLSALRDITDKLEGLNLGAVDYITKPFEPAEVVVRLKKHLTIRNLQKRLEAKNAQLEQEIARRVQAEEALLRSEERYRSLFDNSLNGFALHEIVTNDQGRVNDYIFLEVNRAFEEFTGLKAGDILGRRVTEILPGIENDPFIQIYGRVALTGEPTHFEQFATPLNRYYNIAAFSPRKGQFAVIFSDITERVQVEEQLKASLQEKEVLLREVHHRVKNNLQVVFSLLDMSSRRATQPEVIDLLIESQARIQTMALIHTQLYQSDRFNHIDLVHHIRQLVNFMEQVYAPQSRAITVSIESPAVTLSIIQAVPCALALNEVLANAYRHAFPGREKGTIQISIQYQSETDKGHPPDKGHPAGTIIISVKDDGIGLPAEIDVDTADSLGLKLVRGLVQGQLRGNVQFERDQGTQVTMAFKILTQEDKP